MLSGGLTALGARLGTTESQKWVSHWTDDPVEIGIKITLGIIMAASLNCASNSLNQIFDFDVDKVNKPDRHLPSGTMSMKEAWGVSIFFYALSLGLAAVINMQCFVIVFIAALMTYIYSAPPFRTKRWGVAANMTIAIPRGVLLKVAGWSTVKSVLMFEPWFIGGLFGLFLLGASTTKDFSDMKGDKLGGCITLPIKYGVKRAAYMISPSFLAPFVLISVGGLMGIMTGNEKLLTALGVVLTLYGAYVIYLMLRKPDELALDENHVSWKHMYLMMFITQIGLAAAYLL